MKREVHNADGALVAVLTTTDIADVTCACGTALVRNGVTVQEHWIGGRCDACDRKARHETLNTLSD